MAAKALQPIMLHRCICAVLSEIKIHTYAAEIPLGSSRVAACRFADVSARGLHPLGWLSVKHFGQWQRGIRGTAGIALAAAAAHVRNNSCVRFVYFLPPGSRICTATEVLQGKMQRQYLVFLLITSGFILQETKVWKNDDNDKYS